MWFVTYSYNIFLYLKILDTIYNFGLIFYLKIGEINTNFISLWKSLFVLKYEFHFKL